MRADRPGKGEAPAEARLTHSAPVVGIIGGGGWLGRSIASHALAAGVRLIGLEDVRATLAMLRTPDGQGIELDKFHTPDAIRFGPVDAPVNTLGIRRVMFAVDDIDGIVARMRAHGAELIGEMQYEDTYRLAYIRGPEGIIVALAEQLG